jgi:uncharacterized repeat protein (TIGR01451 family)
MPSSTGPRVRPWNPLASGPGSRRLGRLAGGLALSLCAVGAGAQTPTLSVSLSASPAMGTAPLNGVDLVAGVQGTAVGSITYTFYCHRIDAGTDATTGYALQQVDGAARLTATDLCSYAVAGTYTAKVIVEREGQKAEARVEVVAAGSTLGASAQSLYYVGDSGQTLYRSSMEGAGAVPIMEPPVAGTSLHLVAVSNNGRWIAFTHSYGDNGELWVANLDGSDPHKVADAPWTTDILWFPGDQEIGFRAASIGGGEDGAYYRVASSGGAPTQWISTTHFTPFGRNCFGQLSLSSISSRFAATVGICSGGDYVTFVGTIDVASGTLSNIRQLSPDSSGWDRVSGSAVITPDGETVFYTWREASVRTPPTALGQIRRVAFDGNGERVIWSAELAYGPGWLLLSPDGLRLFFNRDALPPEVFASVKLDGSDYQEHASGLGSRDFGPAPVNVYYQWNGELWRARADGQAPTPVLVSPSPTKPITSLRLTEDGERVAFTIGATGLDDELWTAKTDGTDLRKILEAPSARSPVWLPGNTEVGFRAALSPDLGAYYRAPVSGGAASPWISSSAFAAFGKNCLGPLALSGDASRFAAPVGLCGGDDQIALAGHLDAASGAVSSLRRLSPASSGSTRASSSGLVTRDGTTAFYTWRDDSVPQGQIRRLGFDGSGEQVIWSAAATGGPSTLRLWPDGSRLWFLNGPANAQGRYALSSTGLDGAEPRVHFETTGEFDFGPGPGAVAATRATFVAMKEQSVAGLESQPGLRPTLRLLTGDGQPTSQDVTARYQTRDGTAVAGDDYRPVSGTVSFPAGTASGTEVALEAVEFVDDSRSEGPETLTVEITTVSNALVGSPASLTITIRDDDVTRNDWPAAGSMGQRRSRHTSTLLRDGTVLAAGGRNASGVVATAETFDPARGTWTATGPMTAARYAHSATHLPDGRVLVVGGWGAPEQSASLSAEIYSPATRQWTAVTPPHVARAGHTATLLTNGRVLVAGGRDQEGVTASAEEYDPATGTWSLTTGPLGAGRDGHTATLLPDGHVLVAGGRRADGHTTGACEVYDPAAGTWRTVGAMATAREHHQATLLPGGTVLAFGGRGDGLDLDSAEEYDATSDSWAPAPRMPVASGDGASAALLPDGRAFSAGASTAQVYDPLARTWTRAQGTSLSSSGHAVTLLPSGRVLVSGGESGGYLALAQVFDPSRDTWNGVDPMTTVAGRSRAVPLPNGRVLVVGGSAERFDPASGTWSPAGTPACGHGASFTLLPSGKVLAAGGDCGGAQRTAQLYDPAANTWTATTPLARARFDHSATLLADGRVLVAGGQDGTAPLGTTEIFDSATGLWTSGRPLVEARYGHTASLLGSGRVLVNGGVGASTRLASSEIYDALLDAWTPTGSLGNARLGHTATLLPSGRVLVAGGGSALAELFDPETGRWLDTGRLAIDRLNASATLLPGGQVLLAGGSDFLGNTLAPAELYEPATGVWRPAGVLQGARSGHATALLPDGRVLLAGGNRTSIELSSAEVYASGLVRDDRRPAVTAAPVSLAYGVPGTVSGTGFHSDSEGGGGTSAGAAVDFPLVQLRSLESGRLHWLPADPRSAAWTWHGTETLDLLGLPDALDRGWYALTLFAAGVPSLPRVAQASCGLEVVQPPLDATVPVGGQATFSVTVRGAREYQWLKDGSAIPGATGATYTTPPASPSDTGTTYRVRVRGGCGAETTTAAVLRIEDHTPPDATVVSPAGGEYWLLSPESGPPNESVVTWSMSDDVRICRVEADLLASTDGGATYVRVPAAVNLDPTKPNGTAVFGPGGACALAEQVTATSVRYTLPSSFSLLVSGALYKVEVRVTDHAGNALRLDPESGVRAARSPNPFYVVKANPDSVRTLILKNTARMQAKAGVTPPQATALDQKLQELAAHPRVLGFVVDLAGATGLGSLYADWDADPGSPEKANQVLFGCHAPSCAPERDGVHDLVRSLLRAYSGVKHLVVVGDDRIVPLARLVDRTTLLPESAYTAEGSLNAAGSTVGRALAANRYLSDDPLGVVDGLSPDDLIASGDLSSYLFISDLSTGRLVETPREMTQAIATFISQDGVLDLSAEDPASGHKVLVTGYDFLVDTATQVRAAWKAALGVSTSDDSPAPVDGELVSTTWGLSDVAQRRAALRTHLAGHGTSRYGVSMLLGHASHFEEGVPGTSPLDIQGLSTADIYGADACAAPTQGELALAGSVVFAVGCHGGLPVPGSCSTDADRSLDLPQAFLSRGVLAYAANTGYGWGLKYGIGYSERLLQLLTEELTSGGTAAVGDAVKRAKLRYYLETPHYDVYDQKSLMQWTLFGLPMYAVKTGIAAANDVAAPAFTGKAPPASAPPARQRFGAVEVTQSPSESSSPNAGEPPPAFLTRLDLRFDFTAFDVYIKRGAGGDALPSTPGCPDPVGCYYTLNGLVERSGAGDLPIQPFFVYDSRLSGTSQHGVLWKGGEYEEESGWKPLIGELVSNGGDGSSHGSTPRTATIKPIAPRVVGGEEPAQCRPSDLEVASLVVTAGEAVKTQGSDPQFTIERKYQTVDLEALYFNDTRTSTNNCNRQGPALSAGPHHEVVGADVDFAVGATDPEGVWRVLVVWTDNTVDAQRRGRWRPLELEYDPASHLWKGHVTVTGGSRLTYVIEAVDRRGNVSWLDYESAEPPSSRADLGLPQTVDVSVAPGAAPTVTGFAPAAAPVGAEVTVEGTGFVGSTAVSIGGAGTSFAVVSSTSLRALVPYGAAVGPITVTTPYGTATSTRLFTPTSLAVADVSIAKDGPASATRGEHIAWTVTAANAGPDEATGLAVTDNLPADVIGATWTCVASPGSSCTGGGSGSIFDTATLPPGGTATYAIAATVAPTAAVSLVNTARVTVPAWVTDPTSGDHGATVTTSVSGEASGQFFYTVPPCRVVDTRADEGPILTAGAVRSFAIAGPRCQVPSGAKAVAVIATVTAPSAAGNVRLWPSATPTPGTSTINYVAGQTRANSAVVGLGANGELSAVAGPSGQVHLIVDVAGYFQ